MQLEEVRPWEPNSAPIAKLTVAYDLFGKEVGMSRAFRKQLLAA